MRMRADSQATCHRGPPGPRQQTSQELEAMSRYTSPVNPAVFPHLTVVLLAIGMFFTAWFFVYPSNENRYMREEILPTFLCMGDDIAASQRCSRLNQSEMLLFLM
ncbi:transmembrane protein 258 isoform X1 [Hyla sarda]|uniref:transmembrane protein 258 isoform X1 n=1 Tax=Hyla sarda TaxID=327740 RepID=UPI0024C45C94|nr:transmembrane protein 258 isoform X1 [Hyla sarda]